MNLRFCGLIYLCLQIIRIHVPAICMGDIDSFLRSYVRTANTHPLFIYLVSRARNLNSYIFSSVISIRVFGMESLELWVRSNSFLPRWNKQNKCPILFYNFSNRITHTKNQLRIYDKGYTANLGMYMNLGTTVCRVWALTFAARRHFQKWKRTRYPKMV